MDNTIVTAKERYCTAAAIYYLRSLHIHGRRHTLYCYFFYSGHLFTTAAYFFTYYLTFPLLFPILLFSFSLLLMYQLCFALHMTTAATFSHWSPQLHYYCNCYSTLLYSSSAVLFYFDLFCSIFHYLPNFLLNHVFFIITFAPGYFSVLYLYTENCGLCKWNVELYTPATYRMTRKSTSKKTKISLNSYRLCEGTYLEWSWFSYICSVEQRSKPCNPDQLKQGSSPISNFKTWNFMRHFQDPNIKIKIWCAENAAYSGTHN